MNSLIKRPVIVIILVNLVILLFAEVLVRIMAYNGLVPYRKYPTEAPKLLDDINPHWGVWHYPNVTVNQEGACYNVTITTNSYGARDKERSFQSDAKQRVVVIGDSFIEGFGVEANERLTEQAELLSGIEMLNFGTSGDFSSTQQYLLYRELASKFDHTHIALFLLPDNDFSDNRIENFSPRRFRPYLRKNDQDQYEIYYSVAFEEREQSKGMSTGRSFRRKIYNNIYLLNVFRQLGDIFEASTLKDVVSEPFINLTDTSYDDYSAKDLDKLLWGYKKLIEIAKDKPVTIFVIPREVDFVEAEAGRFSEKLITELNNFAANFKNVKIIDLLPHFRKHMQEKGLDYQDIFLPCDGHWSPQGHQLAAEALIRALGY